MGQDALIDTDWLAQHLHDPDVVVLDGTWHMPASGRDARAEFSAEHVPGARFFEIDAIADTSSDLPHMLPAPDAFREAVEGLGVRNDDLVVVYDTAGLFSAARVWWTFRVFGHDRVAVLNGGLPKWKREGRPTEAGVSTTRVGRFTPHFRPSLVRTLEEMQDNLQTKAEQVLDARGAGRFRAEEPEPRAGVRGGHIPGSMNLPYGAILEEDGTIRPPEALRAAFARAGIDLSRSVTTTCGSGITAALLALGLFLIGNEAAVYDGSWSEWGSRADTPVAR